MNPNNYTQEGSFNQKHLLTLQDWDASDILHTLSLALSLKNKQQNNESHETLAGKSLAMIFAKSSTRTRISFEVGMQQLGGHAIFLNNSDIQLGRGESIADTAKVLSRYVDGIMIRTFEQSDVEQLAAHASIPIINGLTDLFHPCQALADLLTFYEYKNSFQGRKLAYIGDGANNMAHSLLICCSKLGIDIALAFPDGYAPNPEILAWGKANGSASGSRIFLTHNPLEAASRADAVYTDVWASMGMEQQRQQRLQDFQNYSVDDAIMGAAQKDAVFMHCLPAHRGEEVASSVIDGPQSIIFDQAENRLHVQKAVMALLMS